jgi:hypothetical protein
LSTSTEGAALAASVEVLEVAIVVAMVEAKLTIVDVADDTPTLVLYVSWRKRWS